MLLQPGHTSVPATSQIAIAHLQALDACLLLLSQTLRRVRSAACAVAADVTLALLQDNNPAQPELKTVPEQAMGEKAL